MSICDVILVKYLVRSCRIINASTTFIYELLYYLPNPSARAGYDTRSIFKRSLTGLNSEFSFS